MSKIDTNNLTREQAVEIAGEEAVARAERVNCDFTNRVLTDGLVEFSAGVNFDDADGIKCVLNVYYYQTQEAVDSVEQLDELDWEIDHYAIY